MLYFPLFNLMDVTCVKCERTKCQKSSPIKIICNVFQLFVVIPYSTNATVCHKQLPLKAYHLTFTKSGNIYVDVTFFSVNGHLYAKLFSYNQ